MATEAIELPKELRDAIRTAAERSGQTEHELIIEALQARFFPRPANPLPPGHPLHDIVGIDSDPGLSSENIEGWLEENWRPEEHWYRE